jgi:putative transposase
MEYESTAYAKFLLLSHLIFVCQYRKRLLLASGAEVKQIFQKIAEQSDFCCTIGNASQATIRQSIEQQG